MLLLLNQGLGELLGGRLCWGTEYEQVVAPAPAYHLLSNVMVVVGVLSV
jgi:hypothetical protein